MTRIGSRQNFIKSIVLLLTMALPTYIMAADEFYSSHFINQSKQSGSEGFRLVKTKVWPNSACVTDSGKDIVNPGESTELKIKKSNDCNESGVGYSIYKIEDAKNEHLLGYVSHRLGDGKFSLQISRFCEGDQCIFTGLNPEQHRT